MNVTFRPDTIDDQNVDAVIAAQHPAFIAAVTKAVESSSDPEWVKLIGTKQWLLWIANRVPPMYRTATMSDLTDGQHPADLTAWADNPDARNLFIVGPVGTGKTHAAYALTIENAAWSCVTRTSRPLAYSVAGLLDALRPSGSDSEQTWDAVRDAPLLLLDDLAHTRPTDWAVERMWMLADHRTAHNLRTIVTANATAEELEAVWGRGTMDRLLDAAVVVRIAGDSRRRLAW